MTAAHLVHTVAWTLVHFLWQGCAIAAAFAVVMLAMRRAPAAQRYLAGCVALTMMAVAPFATFAWMWQRIDDHAAPERNALGGGEGSPAVAAIAEVDPTLLAIVIAWLVGACALGVWVAGGWWQTRRLRSLVSLPAEPALAAVVVSLARRIGSSAAVRVVDSARVIAPMTIGVVKPIVLIPAAMLGNLSPAHLEAIIAHELAHVRRLDFLINLLQAALEALLFYHPAVWWVSRAVRQEREYCCDDIAADVCGNKVTYARALAELETLRGVSLRLGLSSQGGSLMKRIARLVGEGPGSATASLRSRLAAPTAALALVGVTTAAFALAEAPKVQSPAAPPAEDAAAIAADGMRFEAVRSFYKVAADQAEGHDGEHQAAVLDYFITLDGACDANAAGEWVAAEVAGQPLNQADTTTLRWLRVADALQSANNLVAAEPPIDPAKMPSEGLMRAAQYAYPFNLFDLTPWVDPRVHDLLAPPEEQPIALLLRARVVEMSQAKIELEPTVVNFQGSLLLNALGEDEVHELSADQVTVEFLPAEAATEDMLFEIVDDASAEIISVEGQPIEWQWVVEPPTPTQAPAPKADAQPKMKEPAPEPAPAPTPAAPAAEPTPAPAPKP